MVGSTWDELVRSLPAVPEVSAPEPPTRNLEQFTIAMRDLATALEEQPSAETVLGLLEAGVDRLMGASGAADATVFILDEQTRELSFVVVRGRVPAERLKWRKLARGFGIAGWVADNAAHVVANDTNYDSRFCSWFDEELEFRTRTVIAVPILHAHRVMGVVELLNKTGKGLFTNVDLALCTVFANLAGQILGDLNQRGESTAG